MRLVRRAGHNETGADGLLVVDADALEDGPLVELSARPVKGVCRGGQLRDALAARLVQSVWLLESRIPCLESRRISLFCVVGADSQAGRDLGPGAAAFGFVDDGQHESLFGTLWPTRARSQPGMTSPRPITTGSGPLSARELRKAWALMTLRMSTAQTRVSLPVMWSWALPVVP
jgi:hypothetical protein